MLRHAFQRTGPSNSAATVKAERWGRRAAFLVGRGLAGGTVSSRCQAQVAAVTHVPNGGERELSASTPDNCRLVRKTILSGSSIWLLIAGKSSFRVCVERPIVHSVSKRDGRGSCLARGCSNRLHGARSDRRGRRQPGFRENHLAGGVAGATSASWGRPAVEDKERRQK